MYNSIQDIKQAVERNEGILTLSMGDLRDAYGVKRCRPGNLDKISTEIRKHGLDHYPGNLPNSQDKKVHVFDPDSPFAKNLQSQAVSVKPITDKLSKEERFGDQWNDFGPPPNDLEYAIEGQLNNARASRDYSVLHGRLHPYSITAKKSYEKTIERCFVCEKRVFEIHQNTGLKFPKDFRFEYFNSKEVPQELVGEAPEGTDVIEGYKIKGFGKAKEGAGITLPITLATRPRRTR